MFTKEALIRRAQQSLPDFAHQCRQIDVSEFGPAEFKTEWPSERYRLTVHSSSTIHFSSDAFLWKTLGGGGDDRSSDSTMAMDFWLCSLALVDRQSVSGSSSSSRLAEEAICEPVDRQFFFGFLEILAGKMKRSRRHVLTGLSGELLGDGDCTFVWGINMLNGTPQPLERGLVARKKRNQASSTRE